MKCAFIVYCVIINLHAQKENHEDPILYYYGILYHPSTPIPNFLTRRRVHFHGARWRHIRRRVITFRAHRTSVQTRKITATAVRYECASNPLKLNYSSRSRPIQKVKFTVQVSRKSTRKQESISGPDGCSSCSQPSDGTHNVEESERSLPACGATQACAVRLERYWRRPAVVRLCRCARRLSCPAHPLNDDYALELNNRAHFKFCEPVTNWPECAHNETAVAISADYQIMNPEELEEQHYQNNHPIQPPTITFQCRCRYPYTWSLDLNSNNNSIQQFKCMELSPCKSGDFCGNVRDDLMSLYQSCLCPQRHICVHNGGIDYVNISEILYRGKGKRAYCQRYDDGNQSYEDY